MLRREAEELRKQMEQLSQERPRAAGAGKAIVFLRPVAEPIGRGFRTIRAVRTAKQPAEPQSAAPAKSAEPAATAAGARPRQSGAERHALGAAIGPAARTAGFGRDASRSAAEPLRAFSRSAAHDERDAAAAGVFASRRSGAARRGSQGCNRKISSSAWGKRSAEARSRTAGTDRRSATLPTRRRRWRRPSTNSKKTCRKPRAISRGRSRPPRRACATA